MLFDLEKKHPVSSVTSVLPPFMARKQVATRLDEDTVKALDDYVESSDSPDRNNADAFRRFVREGLANRDYPVPVADGGMMEQRVAQLESANSLQNVHNGVIVMTAAYILLTVTMGLSGLRWLLAGLGLIAVSYGLIYIRYRGEE